MDFFFLLLLSVYVTTMTTNTISTDKVRLDICNELEYLFELIYYNEEEGFSSIKER